MGFSFGSGNSLAMRLNRKIVPKEFRKAVPKEIQGSYIDKKVGKETGYVPDAEPPPPGIPPPESIDADAYRMRQRNRRRYSGSSSTIRTSNAGAAYSPAPKSLLGS